jgi:hypothetical protein
VSLQKNIGMYTRICLLFICLVVSVSCNKNSVKPDASEADYIVFGHFYGFCMGEECIEIFKLTNTGLYEDTSDTYPRWDRYYEGNYVQLDQEKFELVKSLGDHIPEELIQSQDTVFGSPDAADGGGVYFAIKSGEQSRFWVIDQVDNNIPEYLKSFKTKINESIHLINQ